MSYRSRFSHLKQVNQTYFYHCFFGLKWGVYLIYTGIISIIHGLFPFFFPFRVPRHIFKVWKMLENSKEHEFIIRELKKDQ